MSARAITSTQDLPDLAAYSGRGQYTLWQIVGIWALVTLPMALLTWVVAWGAIRQCTGLQTRW